MEIAIKPIKGMDAEIDAPKSKSYTNRALLIAALAEGKTELENVLISDDTMHMISGLRKMGTGINIGKTITVAGTGGQLRSASIFCGNSGTTIRFLTAAATLSSGQSMLDGDSRMRQRPIGELAKCLKQLGAKVETANGFPPLRVKGKLKGG